MPNSLELGYAPRVAEDVHSADESGVTGTPTFFINGRRHAGAYDIDTLNPEVLRPHTRAHDRGPTATPPWGDRRTHARAPRSPA